MTIFYSKFKGFTPFIIIIIILIIALGLISLAIEKGGITEQLIVSFFEYGGLIGLIILWNIALNTSRKKRNNASDTSFNKDFNKGAKIVLSPEIKAGEAQPGLIQIIIQTLREGARFRSAQLALEPKLTQEERVDILKKSGQPGGATMRRGRIEIKPTPEDEEMIKLAAKAGVDSKKPFAVNIIRLKKSIANIGQDIENFIATNGTQFTPELKSNLIQEIKNIRSKLLGNPDGSAILEGIKQDIINTYVSNVQNTHDLYLARQAFDDEIVESLNHDIFLLKWFKEDVETLNRYLENVLNIHYLYFARQAFNHENTTLFSEDIYNKVGEKNLINIINQIRQIMNDYIANTTSNPDYIRDLLEKESLLYKARDILVSKALKEYK